MEINNLDNIKYDNNNFSHNMIPVTDVSSLYVAVYFFLQLQPSADHTSNQTTLDAVQHHMRIIQRIVTRIMTIMFILVCPLPSQHFEFHS